MSARLRRNLLWTAAIAGLIATLTAVEVSLQGTPAGVPLATSVVIFALVNLNVILLMALAVLVFLVAPGAAVAILALAGLLAYEHAFVQAGQAVPLA